MVVFGLGLGCNVAVGGRLTFYAFLGGEAESEIFGWAALAFMLTGAIIFMVAHVPFTVTGIMQ